MSTSEKTKAIKSERGFTECFPQLEAQKYNKRAFEKMRNCDAHFVDDIFTSYLYSVEAMYKDKISVDEYKEHRTKLVETVKNFAASCETKKIEGDYYITM